MAFQIRRIQKFPAPQKARWTLDKVLVNFIRFHPDYRGLQAKQRGTKVSEASLKKKGRKQCAISPREISLEECWRWDSTVESSILSARIGSRIQLLIEAASIEELTSERFKPGTSKRLDPVDRKPKYRRVCTLHRVKLLTLSYQLQVRFQFWNMIKPLGRARGWRDFIYCESQIVIYGQTGSHGGSRVQVLASFCNL